MQLEEHRPTHFRWNVFVVACGTSWLLYLHRYVFALIKPVLVDEWGLGKDELGFLDSAFSLTYTGFQIPLGVATNAFGVHLMLTLMLVVWSIGLGMHAWAPSSKYLWAARATLGLGQSAVFAAQSQLTRTWFSRSVRTTVQGWLGVFFGRFGGLSANLLVGSVLLGIFGLPWRTVVYALTGVGILHAVAFALCYRNSPRNHPCVNDEEAELIEGDDSDSNLPRRLSIGDMLRRMSPRSIGNLLMLNLQTILSTLADNIFSAWIPLFLWEVHSLKFKEMGFYASLPLLGGAIGGAFGGWLNDQMIARTGSLRSSRTIVGATGKGIAGVLLLTSLLWYNEPRLFCAMLFFVKFFSDWSLVTTWGCVTDIGGRTSASVFAFNNSVAGVGSIVGPTLYGLVAENYGWVPVFVTAAVTYGVCALTWLLINCEIPVIKSEST
ncbi:MAG: MFS transporter [Planctomycetaceae bacterium]|nr:MFS transporter [Planctomycetales bacterium]MCB9925460.1 MFS transporter [Planctomycetaceae bacterium]